jgi:phage gpG-like protein
MRGLRIDPALTSAMLPIVTFEPTLGITAARIDKLSLDIRSFKEPLTRSIREVMGPSFRRNFDVGGRPSWEELSEGTREIQERLKGSSDHSVLVLTGALRQTMGQINIWTIGKDAAILKDIPARVWYGKIHQAGYGGSGSARSAGGRTLADIVARALSGESGGAGAHPIPARPFVVLHKEDEENIIKVFEKWLGERIDRAWPRTGGF